MFDLLLFKVFMLILFVLLGRLGFVMGVFGVGVGVVLGLKLFLFEEDRLILLVLE